ncbi:methylenetetrahydrofolate reductase [Arthrobacter mobilis]|uniref:Methylenetetrahydrofolate reductase n=1 Tax=Arthrobacter mobilis TaxID=2724944 RepID=A0A7X6HDQ9_9MICC|nr:methylenetetrahydrofolate reductase [Arthrobacter mobilis]NKX55126.1 5,10-methylenetetrahydrofolate reductase [Arthrobacter mobilis]
MTFSQRAAAPPSLSYELYPPARPEAEASVLSAIEELEATNPDYVSVTYSGTPARRRASIQLIEHLMRNTRLRPLAHLTCVGETRDSLDLLVRQIVGLGVRGVLAMRGDLPQDPEASRGELPFARYLVELIREVEARHGATLAGGRLAVGVAAYPNRHPESPSFQHDVEVLVSKERSGADFAITQVYFDPAHYVRLVAAARAAGVTIPIIPGVIPMSSVRRLERLAVMTGVRPDAALLHRLETASDDAERQRIGVKAAAELARAAFDAGAPGLHLYTFNDPHASIEVIEQVGLPAARTLSTPVPA